MTKRVSDDVFARIASALDQIASDPTARRTKREIEQRSGLSHDTVARAFRQDTETPTHWHISDRLNGLLNTTQAASRRSPQQAAEADLRNTIRDRNREIERLNSLVDGYANLLLAHHLEQTLTETNTVIPLRPKPRD